MTSISFHIEYHTQWGQQLFVCGSDANLGQLQDDCAIPMTYNNGSWSLDVSLASSTRQLTYYYLVKQGDLVVRREWGNPRRITIRPKSTARVWDSWQNQPYHSYLYDAVFAKSICAHADAGFATQLSKHSIVVRVRCPYATSQQALKMVGDAPVLGSWNVAKAPVMAHVGNGEWEIVLSRLNLKQPTSYKFVLINSETQEAVHWEEGDNRMLPEAIGLAVDVMYIMGLAYRYPSFQYKGTGVAIPVFSLRTNSSFGIGDFTDLHKMVDWTALTHQQIIQLLPINDTTTTHSWKDSYPYSAISTYALHPIYLGCQVLPLSKKTKMKTYLSKVAKLNALPEIDYDAVLALKMAYAHDLFDEQAKKVMASADYQQFAEKNTSWLFAYACFCQLRDQFGTADFSRWENFATYDEATLRSYLSTHPEAQKAVDFHCFIQYLLDKQLSEVRDYAHSKGVSLKGDIPIGISRESIDAWTHAHLFNMDTQTGAPPDDFSVFGQNWGFPTYNWHAMAQDGYAWWKERFQKMSDYFDAYRIDHILGFFRIWEIPLHAVQGLLGYFSPALPYWAEELWQAGFPFDEERMTTPFIHEHFLGDFFGEYTEEVKQTYLEPHGWERYRLKAECQTQQAIKALFADKSDNKSLRIRDGLYVLCNEVLFVRDAYDGYRFHPRITAQYTYSYRYLDDGAKAAFNRLYDDFYYHKHNYYWREQAMKKLPSLISSTNMMVCGEDLGMVPACVPSVMNELNILSLEIERMPKNPQQQFTDLHWLPYLSVCTTSTHDMSPIRLWWTENKETTQNYYNSVLHRQGEAPQICSCEIAEQIVRQHLQSSAMWVILPWQDWMAIDERVAHPQPEQERINVPANPNHYWRYRMHLSLDDLLANTDVNNHIQSVINQCR